MIELPPVDPDDRAKAIEVMRQQLIRGGMDAGDAPGQAAALVDLAIAARNRPGYGSAVAIPENGDG